MNNAKTIGSFPAGKVTLPPSKSLSHRAVICAGLAAANGGASALHNVGQSQDIEASMVCVKKLYADWEYRNNALCAVPRARKETAQRTLDCGESGSTLRFMIPLAAMTGQEWRFVGRGRLMERPQQVYGEVFAQSGAHFLQEDGAITVQGPLRAGEYRLRGDVSSQFLSGLLLALPMAEGDSRLILTTPLESAAYVDLTCDVMEHFGVRVSRDGEGNYHIPGGQKYRAAEYTVEGDYSQAAFFLGAAALGRPVACGGLSPNSRQGDAAILRVLQEMGVSIQRRDGLLYAQADSLTAVTVDVREIPDLVPPLAALCCFAEGESHIVNAARLRLKESDRLAALAEELGHLGADIQQTEDSLIIKGKPQLPGGACDAHGDHRIAMAAALAAIGCTGPVTLTGWDSVAKSYPTFWEDFEKEARHG